jgi:hypothetical protein
MSQNARRFRALFRWTLPLAIGAVSAVTLSTKAHAATKRHDCYSWTGCVGAPTCKPVDLQVWCIGQDNEPGCWGGEGDCP